MKVSQKYKLKTRKLILDTITAMPLANVDFLAQSHRFFLCVHK